MELGIVLFELRTGPGKEIDELIIPHAAKRAEEIGLGYAALPDRVSRPTYRFDTLTLSAAIAVMTERIRIKTHIFVLPLRQPIELARRLVTLDWLSHGRFILEGAIGGAQATTKARADNTVYNKEYADVGIPSRERGARANEILEILVALWTEQPATFKGRHYAFEDVEFNPKPYSTPHVPIWIGGNSEPALRRAARFGSGFSPDWSAMQQLGGPAAIRGKIAEVRRDLLAQGVEARDPNERVHLSTCYKTTINRDAGKAVDEGRSFWESQRGSIEGAQPFEVKVAEGVYGEPAQLVDKIKEIESSGVDSLNLHVHSYDVMGQLALLESDVLPRL